MKKLLALMAMLFLMLFVACQNIGGTTDDTDTDIAVATLLNEAGLPVPNATVRVYTFRDSTGIPVDSTVTNANGSYELEASLTPGSYSLWAETDSSVLFREDLIIKTDSAFVDTNTLVSARSIWVPVKMHKDHDPRTVEAQIWGTPIRHNVSADGFLVLDKITLGTYFTRLTTTLEGYTPTNDSFTITALSPDTLLDTLELIYTGLPRVIVGSVVLSNGTPAANASVRVYPYRDTTGLWVDSLTIDVDGTFETKQLVAGRYSLWIEGESEMSFREDIIVAENEKTMITDTLTPIRKILVPVKVQPNHNSQTVEAQIYGTPIRNNVSADGYLVLDKISTGSYVTHLSTTLEGYVPTNQTIEITATSSDTLLDTLELIYTNIPVVTGLAYTYDTLNTTVNLSWDQSVFNDIQAYAIERKLKSETLWPVAPLQLVYVSQASHPTTFSDVVSVGEAGVVYQYRIKIVNNGSLMGMPFGVLEVNAVSSSSAVTTITASSMQKAKAIVGNRASINDVMSFTVNFSNPSRKLTKAEWFEGAVLLKTTPLTELITTDSYEQSWSTIGAKTLTVKVTDDAGIVWEKLIPVSIVEDKPIISFVDTTINLNVLDTLTAVVSDEFGEIVSYHWDWGNDGTIDATTPEFVKTQTEIERGVPCKVTVTDDDGNVGEFISGVTSQLVWEKVGELPVDLLFSNQGFFKLDNQLARLDDNGFIWSSIDGISWMKRGKVDVYDEGVVPWGNYYQNFVECNGSAWGIMPAKSENGLIVTMWKSSNLDDWELVFQSEEINYKAKYYATPMLLGTSKGIFANLFNQVGVMKPKMTLNGVNWENCETDIYFSIMSRGQDLYESIDDIVYEFSFFDAREIVVNSYNNQLSDKNTKVSSLSYTHAQGNFYTGSCQINEKVVISYNAQLYLYQPQKKILTPFGVLPMENQDVDEYFLFEGVEAFNGKLFFYTRSGQIWSAG